MNVERFESMGTMISVHSPQRLPAGAIEQVRAVFDEFDQRFSLYKPRSEASRVARREIRVGQASEVYRDVYWQAHDWQGRTDGAFTSHRPNGEVDLSGIVKALAMNEAGTELNMAGVRNWCLNAGGDVLAAGQAAPGASWVAGIVDPDDQLALVSQSVLDAPMSALATSGTQQRGEHIWRVPSPQLAGSHIRDAFTQVSVLAADIVTADVLATAILSGGQPMLDKAIAEHRIEVLAFSTSGRVWATDRFRQRAA